MPRPESDTAQPAAFTPATEGRFQRTVNGQTVYAEVRNVGNQLSYKDDGATDWTPIEGSTGWVDPQARPSVPRSNG